MYIQAVIKTEELYCARICNILCYDWKLVVILREYPF